MHRKPNQFIWNLIAHHQKQHFQRLLSPGRRVAACQPATMVPNQSPVQPVVVEGGWTEQTQEEIKLMEHIRHTEVCSLAFKTLKTLPLLYAFKSTVLNFKIMPINMFSASGQLWPCRHMPSLELAFGEQLSKRHPAHREVCFVWMETRNYDLSQEEKKAQWICTKVIIISVFKLNLMASLLITPKGM